MHIRFCFFLWLFDKTVEVKIGIWATSVALQKRYNRYLSQTCTKMQTVFLLYTANLVLFVAGDDVIYLLKAPKTSKPWRFIIWCVLRIVLAEVIENSLAAEETELGEHSRMALWTPFSLPLSPQYSMHRSGLSVCRMSFDVNTVQLYMSYFCHSTTLPLRSIDFTVYRAAPFRQLLLRITEASCKPDRSLCRLKNEWWSSGSGCCRLRWIK